MTGLEIDIDNKIHGINPIIVTIIKKHWDQFVERGKELPTARDIIEHLDSMKLKNRIFICY